jgi:hypothetical protein
MPEIDFDGLRAQVENNTYLPEFHEVQKRARRVRRRHRLRVLIAVAAVATPAVGAADAFYHQPRTGSVTATNDGSSVVHLNMPTAKAQPNTWTLVAADGVDLSHMFGLVDVCAGMSCDMEVSSVDPGGILGTTQRIDLFRNASTDRVTDPRIVAIDADTVIVSARVNEGPVQSQTLNLTALPTKAPPPSSGRAVQAAESGDIQLAGSRGSITPLPASPPLTSPRLVTTMAGWWVCGIDPNSGAPTLAVSRDSGRSWSMRPTGLSQIDATPAIVEQSGKLYMLVGAGGRMTLQRSSDGGQTWTTLQSASTWPASARYGLITAKDKSLIVWFTTNSGGTVIVRSRDDGATFTPYRNPGSSTGPIVAVNGGYLMLGSKPVLSHDGVNWSAATVPWIPLR